MRRPSILKVIVVVLLMSVNCFTRGQNPSVISNNSTTDKSAKPYKILTSGNQITIQLNQTLRSLMVWTASGHRIVEEKEIQTSSYTFTVPSKEKIFFMVIETSGGKRFTEKMGVK